MTDPAHGWVVTGRGAVRQHPGEPECDPRPFLKVRKTRKFMGSQDALAVVAAGRALADAGLGADAGGERAGLFLVVGYIPFDRADIERLADGAVDAGTGRLDMAAFSTRGVAAISPLLTFRCLPNMPAFHVSANFDVQGHSHVGYPSPGQLYLALEQAVAALEAGRIDRALLGGVAHQRNFLVEQQAARFEPPIPPDGLGDAAGFLVLETRAAAAARGARPRVEPGPWSVTWRPHDPFVEAPVPREVFEGVALPAIDLGAASLPVALAEAAPGRVTHRLEGRDGLIAASEWGIR